MIRLGNVAIFSGALPIISVFSAYYIAASHAHVPDCMPLFEGCTSISSTGRASPESLFFRATMIPSAMFMMLYWYLMKRWLEKIFNDKHLQFQIIILLGFISSVFLIVYTIALGFIDPVYGLQRRIGVTLFFACALISQLMVSDQIYKAVKAGRLSLPYGLHYWLVVICVLMLLIGLSSIPVSIYFPHTSLLDNIIEWSYAVVMYSFYIVTGFIWRATDYRLDFHVETNV